MEKPNRPPVDTANPTEFIPAENRVRAELLARMVAGTEETYNPSDPEWLRLAACSVAGIASDNFFGTEANHRPAKEVCGRRGIALPCLRYALDNNEKEGIWSGTDMKDRKAIRAELIRRQSSSA